MINKNREQATFLKPFGRKRGKARGVIHAPNLSAADATFEDETAVVGEQQMNTEFLAPMKGEILAGAIGNTLWEIRGGKLKDFFRLMLLFGLRSWSFGFSVLASNPPKQ